MPRLSEALSAEVRSVGSVQQQYLRFSTSISIPLITQCPESLQGLLLVGWDLCPPALLNAMLPDCGGPGSELACRRTIVQRLLLPGIGSKIEQLVTPPGDVGSDQLSAVNSRFKARWIRKILWY